MKTPPVVREVLPCGLTVVVETIPHVRSAALGFYLRSGSAAESAENSGASHFLEHLVFKGTVTRSTADIALVVDELGGDVDAFTGKEYTSFYAHVLDEQAATALELLTDLVLNPRYTDSDMEMRRDRGAPNEVEHRGTLRRDVSPGEHDLRRLGQRERVEDREAPRQGVPARRGDRETVRVDDTGA
ncbi:MAG: insulinase family protein [Acidobacteria bacterium]|nr:insulinase family protein [Acidobacteriota bacterium]